MSLDKSLFKKPIALLHVNEICITVQGHRCNREADKCVTQSSMKPLFRAAALNA